MWRAAAAAGMSLVLGTAGAACAEAQAAPQPGNAAPTATSNPQAAQTSPPLPQGAAAQPGADPNSALPTLHVLPPPGADYVPPPPSGPLSPLGQALARRGIYLRQIGVDELAGNATGGVTQGVGNSFATAFGTDLDLQRLIGLPGAVFHLTINKSIGDSLAAKYTGNAVSFQTRYKTYHNTRLGALAFEENLFDKKLNITGGLVSALTFFNASTIYCNFQNNSVCFNPSVLPIQNKSLSFFPFNTYGGRVKFEPTPRFYIQAGAFEANTSLQPTDGWHFGTKGATGIQSAGEIGLQSPTDTAPNAYHIRLGVYDNTSPVNDPFLNTHDRSRVQYKGAPLVHEAGQTAWYLMGDVVIARMPGEGRNVTLFGGTNEATPNYLTFKNQTLLGVVVTGPFRSRPDDTLGLVGSYLRISDQEVDFLQASRTAVHGTDPVKDAEGIFELNYGFKVARGIRINPNIQYVANPDNILRPSTVHQSKDILAFGLRISLEVGAILGLPVWR